MIIHFLLLYLAYVNDVPDVGQSVAVSRVKSAGRLLEKTSRPCMAQVREVSPVGPQMAKPCWPVLQKPDISLFKCILWIFSMRLTATADGVFPIAATLVWSGGVTYVLLKLVSAFVPLRVSLQQELEGLDISQHGEALQ